MDGYDAALDGLLAEVERSAGGARRLFSLRARLTLLAYAWRERPWVFDAARQSSLQATSLVRWLEQGGYTRSVEDVVARIHEVSAALTRRMIEASSWERTREALWVTFEASHGLPPPEAAALGLLYALGGGDEEATSLAHALGIVRPVDAVADAGLAASVLASVVPDWGTTLARWLGEGLIEPVEDDESGARGYRLMSGLQRLFLGLPLQPTAPLALTPACFLWLLGEPRPFDRIAAAIWPQLRPGGSSLRAVVLAPERRSAQAVAAWLMGERGWMIVMEPGSDDTDVGPWLAQAMEALGAGVLFDLTGVGPTRAGLAALSQRAPGPLVAWVMRGDLQHIRSAWPGAVVLDSVEAGRVMTMESGALVGDDGPLRIVSDPLERAIQAARVAFDPTRTDERMAALHATAMAQVQDVAVRPLQDPRCPIVLHPRTRAELDELLHVLRSQESAASRRVFAGGPRRYFVLMDGQRSRIQRQVVLELGRAWGRPIYEIDLSRVLSRYIGEAEERLREVFELARRTGAGLFMDEAHDFLGKRVEVQTTADRYAAMQVNYVLQELDVFDGLLILATTKPALLDAAILRRMLYRVHFGELGVDEREAFWRALVPEEAPIEGEIDWREIAELYELEPDFIQKALFFAAVQAATQGRGLEQVDVEEVAWGLTQSGP